MANADISLLFGVLGEGSLSGESGSLIQSQLTQIMDALNKNPFKVKVELDADSSKKKTWTDQLQKKLDAFNSGNRLSVTVSNIKLGTNAITSFKNQLGAVINTLNLDKDVSISFTAKDIGDITTEFKSAGEAANEAAREAATFKVQMESLGGLKKSLQTSLSNLSKDSNSVDERTRIAELTAQYENLATKIETVRASKNSISDSYRQELEAEASAIQTNINKINQERKAEEIVAAARKAETDSRIAAEKAAKAEADAAALAAQKAHGTESERNTLYKQIADSIIRIRKAQQDWNSAATGNSSADYAKLDTYIKRLQDLQSEFSDLGKSDIRARLTDINKDFANSSTVIKAAGESTQTLSDRVGSLAGKFASWLTISQVIMKVYQALKQMVTAVIEVDTAMTELRKVTNETEETYSKFLDTAVTRAKQMGATVADTVSASADFARLGYTLEEAASLADAAIVYKNVGDGITDINEASESIISTMKAFGIAAEGAMLIVDKFNEVGNNFAISSKGVGDALLRSASALAAGNNTLDESIALITAANSSIQDADVVGTTLKTVSMYLRAAKTEAEEAGESTEGMAESVSKLREEMLLLTGNKVDIQIDEDTFKSTYQIMKELADVWDDLTDISKANILEMVGGKRNSNVVMSLLENFDVAENVIKSTADAAGSALAENEKYLESINGHIAEFKAAFEELSTTLIDSELVKSIITLGTTLLNILGIVAKVIDAFGGLNTILAGLAIRPLIPLFGKLVEAMKLFVAMQKAANTASAGAVVVYGTNSTVLGRLATAFKTAGTAAISAKVAIAGIAAALILIPQIVNACVDAYKKNHKSIEELNEEYKELRSEIDDISDSYRELKSSADETIPRFAELAKGVDKFGKNVSLTDEEYAEFLELNNKIADMFPELNMGMDSSGNAMLALSYSADTLTDSLNALVEAQRNAANQQIAETMPDVLKNIKDSNKSYKKEIDKLKDIQDEYTEVYNDFLNQKLPTYVGGYSTLDAGQTAAEEFIAKAKELGIHGDVLVQNQQSTNNGYVFTVDWDYSPLENNSKSMLDYVDDQFAIVTEKYDKLIDNYQSMIKAKWAQLNPVVSSWMQTNFMFQDLDGTMQEIAEVMISGLDFSSLGKTTEEEVQDYIENYIIKPLFLATPEVKEAMASLTDWQDALKNGEMTSDEFAEKIKTAFDAMFASMPSDSIDEFKQNFVTGFNQIGISGNDFVEVLQNLITEWSRVEQTVQSTNTPQKTVNKFRDIIHILETATDEFRTMGSVSTDTYKDVIALGEDYADLFDFTNGKIELSGDTLSDFIDKLIQEYGAILAANGATEEQIQLLYTYSSALSSATQDTKVTISTMKSLVDILATVKDGTSYSSIAMLELLEQYPELTDAIIETVDGYTIEESAIKLVIAEKAKELKINESLIKSQARLNLIKGAGNSKSADTVDAIFDEYGDTISSFEDYVDAWEKYFSKSADGAQWVSGLKEYVDATIAEAERLEDINKILEDLLSPDQYKFGSSSSNHTEKSETEFDKQYKEHQHLLNMEQESVEDYLNWLTAAYKAAYDTGMIELDDYYKYQEEVYDKTKELFSDYLNDTEHSIFLMENTDSDTNEIVKLYSGMMAAIDAQIQTYQNLGLDKNSDYIQELQKQWWEYRDSILDVYKDALDSQIGDYEHDIFMLEQSKSSSADIIDIYRKMQKALHATAEEYRALGLEENSDYIQELKEQWWEYEEAVVQARRDEFDDKLNDDKFAIEQLKLDGANATEISRSYSNVLKAVNDEIAYYTSKGYDITDEIVQNLIDEAHTLESEVISSLNDIVSEAQNAVDDLQNVYNTLGDAADEYAEYGYITVDSLQSIIDLGVEYMAFLQDENGQLVINKENIQNVIAARTEQLAVESALNYVEQLRLALEAGNTSELERLLYATNEATNATWGLVYANLALLDLDDSQYQAALNNINNLRSLADNAISNIGSSMSGNTQSRSDMLQAELDARKDALQEQKDALDDILDYTMELVKWEAEQQVEALKDQISDYEEIVKLKKEMLKATKEEADYEDSLSDKIEEIAKIQERINALSLDDSRDAQAEKISLEEELADLQKELTDYQADHMLETHENTLDDMADAYSSEKEKEIAAVEETVSSTEKIYQLAIERINNDWNGLYQDLLTYNYEYGNTLQSDLVSAWNAASAAVQEYGSYVQAVSSITSALDVANNTTISSASGTTNLGNTGNYTAEANASKQKVLQISSLVDRMEANSAAWWNASESDRDKLENTNAQIAAQVEALLGEKLVRGADGVWYIGIVGSSRRLYDCYHEGGIVGELSSTKKNETFAVLENGEMVLTDEQQSHLFRLIDFATTLSEQFGKLFETTGYNPLFQRKTNNMAEELSSITEDKRMNIEFGDVYITGTNEETVEKYRDVNRQFVNEVLKQLNVKR